MTDTTKVPSCNVAQDTIERVERITYRNEDAIAVLKERIGKMDSEYHFRFLEIKEALEDLYELIKSRDGSAAPAVAVQPASPQ